MYSTDAKIYGRQKEREVLVPFRNLANYKKMHTKTAEDKGKLTEFLAAPTFTKARKIIFG